MKKFECSMAKKLESLAKNEDSVGLKSLDRYKVPTSMADEMRLDAKFGIGDLEDFARKYRKVELKDVSHGYVDGGDVVFRKYRLTVPNDPEAIKQGADKVKTFFLNVGWNNKDGVPYVSLSGSRFGSVPELVDAMSDYMDHL